jgi:hypothetical protein
VIDGDGMGTYVEEVYHGYDEGVDDAEDDVGLEGSVSGFLEVLGI